MIKNFLMDMGQVVIKFDPEFFLTKYGITDVEDREWLKREVYESIEWVMMDRGTITDKEAAEIMKTHLPERLREFVDPLVLDWHNPIILIQGYYDFMSELKANGYRFSLLSNASFEQKNYWQKVKGKELFENRLVSSEIGLCKPQPEIFKYACEKCGYLPEETCFIDDSPSNCEGAIIAGLKAIVFHGDYQEIRRKARAMGVNISE